MAHKVPDKQGSRNDFSKRVKVLMTVDAVGGVWRYAVDLIQGLVQHGAEAALACMGPRPSAERREELAGISSVVLHESDYALEWMPNPWADVGRAGEWLLEIAAAAKPDVIHLNGYSHAALPWNRPVVIVAHSCVRSWWRSVHGCAAGAEWDQYSQRVRKGLQCASRVVSPSKSMAENLHLDYGVDCNDISVIHNFSRLKAPSQHRKQQFFLAAGRVWDQAKNVGLLDRIAPRLIWPMRIAGSDQASTPGENSIRAAQYLGNLNRADMNLELSRAGIFVHPALYEPFGLAVLEAARAKCSLVLSDIPTFRELWDGAALFLDPRDEDRWIFELNGLAQNRQAQDKLAYLAHSRSKQYSSRKTLQSYQRLYQDMMLSSTAPRKGVAA